MTTATVLLICVVLFIASAATVARQEGWWK